MKKIKMARLIILVILFTAIERTKCADQNGPSRCCHYGVEAAGLSLIEDISCKPDNALLNKFNGIAQTMCSSFYKSCCEHTAQSNYCKMGKNLALANMLCIKSKKIGGEKQQACCDCCKSGRKAAKDGAKCIVDLNTDPMCKESFISCCKQMKSALPVELATKKRTCRNIRCDPRTSKTCVEGSEGARCICKDGYKEANGGTSCKDIDECKTGDNTCPDNCVNQPGGYSCSCIQGMMRVNGKCVEAVECDKGFQRNGEKCEDIDECATGKHRCPKYITTDNFNSAVFCINTPGSYRCRKDCPYPRYRVVGEGLCIDVDECKDARHGCNKHHKCVNTIGGYRCERVSCFEGYKLVGKFCEDINECEVDRNKCGPNGSCRNAQGTFFCDCQSGFKYNSLTEKCEDENECQMDRGYCQYQCINTIGSYKCTCPDGYELRGKLCFDTDECISSPCKRGEFCFNTFGSYSCINETCPTRYYQQRQVHQGSPASCRKTICNENDAQCYKDPIQSVKRIAFKFTKVLLDKGFVFTYTTGFNRRYYSVDSKLIPKEGEMLFRINYVNKDKLEVLNVKEIVGPRKFHFILQTDVTEVSSNVLRWRYNYHFYVYVGSYNF